VTRVQTCALPVPIISTKTQTKRLLVVVFPLLPLSAPTLDLQTTLSLKATSMTSWKIIGVEHFKRNFDFIDPIRMRLGILRSKIVAAMNAGYPEKRGIWSDDRHSWQRSQCRVDLRAVSRIGDNRLVHLRGPKHVLTFRSYV